MKKIIRFAFVFLLMCMSSALAENYTKIDIEPVIKSDMQSDSTKLIRQIETLMPIITAQTVIKGYTPDSLAKDLNLMLMEIEMLVNEAKSNELDQLFVKLRLSYRTLLLAVCALSEVFPMAGPQDIAKNVNFQRMHNDLQDELNNVNHVIKQLSVNKKLKNFFSFKKSVELRKVLLPFAQELQRNIEIVHEQSKQKADVKLKK